MSSNSAATMYERKLSRRMLQAPCTITHIEHTLSCFRVTHRRVGCAMLDTPTDRTTADRLPHMSRRLCTPSR